MAFLKKYNKQDLSGITKKSELVGHATILLPKLWSSCRSLSNMSRVRWALAGKANMYYREKLDEIPNWEGEDLAGKNILVHYGFSGLGDVFFYSRFLTDPKFKDANVTFMCTPITASIMRKQPHIIDNLIEESYVQRQVEGDESSPWVIRFPSEDFKSFIDEKTNFSIYDYRTDIFRLAYVLEIEEDQIKTAPHILIEGESSVSIDSSKLNVGICWGGNKYNRRDRLRSMPRQKIESLIENKKTNFYSLQTKDNEGLEEYDNVFVSEFKDFVDTAKLIKKLDLGISVDTAVLNLAGCMGKPIWLMTQKADKRVNFLWVTPEKGLSAWFENSRMFGAEEDWDGAVEEVSQALIDLVMERILAGKQTDDILKFYHPEEASQLDKEST